MQVVLETIRDTHRMIKLHNIIIMILLVILIISMMVLGASVRDNYRRLSIVENRINGSVESSNH